MTSISEKRSNPDRGRETTAGEGKAPGRRGFLAGAGAVAGIAGAAAVALKSRGRPVADDVAPQAAGTDPGQGRGYHETAHIRKYYDTTKV